MTRFAAAVLAFLGVFMLGVGIGFDAGRKQREDAPAPERVEQARVIQVEFTGCLIWLERADKEPMRPVVFRVPLEMARQQKDR